jgi:alkanesulfonate monooxygenase SsuD/methylene tetrahydromethanopterin reductase-like flavin-dependent oxidoreductase (luciferase family)
MEQRLRFGLSINPEVDRLDRVREAARVADAAGLDLVGVQDHPYQHRFVDTITLIATVLADTRRISVFTNVANLPLRPPAVLAKTAATLDRLSGGRFALGLGAGGFWDAISTMGVPPRTPGESIDALEEAVDVIRLMWSDERAVRYAGTHYRLDGVRPGPAPAHGVPIWLGAYRPRMLRLLGRTADGWLPGLDYPPQAEYSTPEALRQGQRLIDAAARAAGRDPRTIRRVLNLIGDPDVMADRVLALAADGFDTFILWPGTDPVPAAERWAELTGRLARRHGEEQS